MAKKTFGSYSGVPQTGGMGQGTAQVFKPQAIATDTSRLGQGIQSAGQAVAEGLSYYQQQRKAAEDKMREFEKMQKGDYAFTNGLTEQANASIDAMIGNDSPYLNKKGKIKFGSVKEVNDELDRIIAQNEDIKQYEEILRNVYDTAKENQYMTDPETGQQVLAKEWAKNKLTNPPTQEELEAFKTDDLGAKLQGYMFDVDNSIFKTEDFGSDVLSLAKEFALSKDLISEQEYSTITGKDVITKESFYGDEQLGQFKDYVEENPILKGKYLDNYIIENGLSIANKEAIKNSPEFQDAWSQKVEADVDKLVQRRQSESKTSPLFKPKDPNSTDTDGDKEGKVEFKVGQGRNTASYVSDKGVIRTVPILGAGNQNVGDYTIQGTTYLNGKLLAVDETGQVIPDSEDTANQYENIILKGLSKYEVAAYNKAKKELKATKPKEVKPNQAKVTALDKNIKDNAGNFNDDEEAVIEFLETELGFPLTDTPSSDDTQWKNYKEELLEYLKDNTLNFNQATVRNKIIEKLVSEFPTLFLSEEGAEEPTGFDAESFYNNYKK